MAWPRVEWRNQEKERRGLLSDPVGARGPVTQSALKAPSVTTAAPHPAS